MILPELLYFFTYTDTSTQKLAPEYLHEQFVVDMDGQMQILDMGDDNCILGGLSICYIQ